MIYEKAGEYEVKYTATDECGNETSEVREVLVAKNVIAGENITLEQSGNDVTVNADTYSKAEIETALEAKADKSDTYTKSEVDAKVSEVSNPFITVSGSVDNVSINSNSNQTVAVDLNMPSGYTLQAYRQIAVQAATSDGANQTDVIMRWFGSAGNGTKANVALRNIGANTAKIKVEVVVLAMKR